MTSIHLGLGMALFAFAATTPAAVTQLAPNGFLIRHEVTVNAAPAKVYDAIVNVGGWWNPAHTYSGDAANLSIDARAGGCFCERLREGGAVEHMRIVAAMPGTMLRMSGALGPLQSSGLAGSLTWKLAAAGDGTTLTVTYSVGGFMDAVSRRWRPRWTASWASRSGG